MASYALFRFAGHYGMAPLECLDLQIWKTFRFPNSIIAQMFEFDNHQFRNSENWKRFSRFLGFGGIISIERGKLGCVRATHTPQPPIIEMIPLLH